MLVKFANFITENPIIVIVGFLCSIFGTIEVVYSLVINLKTKKQKEELERQRKDIYEYLKNTVEFSEVSRELEKVKSDLQEAHKEMEINIPKVMKQAALNEQIMIEEQIIIKAKERIQKLKIELDENIDNTKKSFTFFKKIDCFITAEQTKSFVALLVILGTFLLFISQIVGGVVAKVFGTLSACISVIYAYNKYEKLRGEKVRKILNSFVNVVLCTYIINTLLKTDFYGFFWWALLVLLLSFLRILMKQGIDINALVSVLCIPLFISIIIIDEYYMYIAILILIFQTLLLIKNIISIVNEIKED